MLAELQEIYDDVLVQTALELRCECEFLTFPSASLENGSLDNAVLSFDFKDGDRLIQNSTISFSEIVKSICLPASVLRFTDTFCTKDKKTTPHRKVSGALPDLANKFAEGSRAGSAERLKKRALRHALD